MKKKFLNRVQDIYLYKRLPENLVPRKVLKKSNKQAQRANQTKKTVGLPLLLRRGARGIHQKKLALKFAPSLKIDVLERGSLISTPCSLKVWTSNVNRSSCSLEKDKKGATGEVPPRLPCEALSPSGTNDRRSLVMMGLVAYEPLPTPSLDLLCDPSVPSCDQQVDQCAGSQMGHIVGHRRGSANQPLAFEGLISSLNNKSKPLSSFKWKNGASLYSCFQLEGSLSKQQEKRSSPLLLQLLERKKLRILYGNLSNREINALIKKAKKNRGGLGDNIFRLLESRLDVVLCKIGFFTTISFARQWIYHGKVQVNSKVLTIANYNLQPGDIISISPSHCQFLKIQIDTLLRRHMVERAATSIIDHHNLSKISTRWTPKGQRISPSKAWFGWGKNRSLSTPIVDNLGTGFKSHPFIQPWPARESLPRTPLNLAKIMGVLMVGPDVIRANNRAFDLRRARNVFPEVTWQKLIRNKLRFFSLKLTHVEVSFKLFTAVYLYSPQRILLPATIDIEKIRKSQTA